MEINEIMIGDWVKCTDPTPIQITVIDSWDMVVKDQDDLRVEIGDLQPIPLTERMLLRNGFEDFGEILTLKWKGGVDNCELNLRKMYNKDNICDAFGCMIGGCVQLIIYVQELQHLLRLCGLDGLASNFKIE